VEQANSIKLSTILWIIAGLIIPLWPISLPFCWYMAYRSYKSGGAVGSLTDLQSAYDMHQKGILSDAEFNKIKDQALGNKKG